MDVCHFFKFSSVVVAMAFEKMCCSKLVLIFFIKRADSILKGFFLKSSTLTNSRSFQLVSFTVVEDREQ